jgi:hypothetical protein
MVVHTYDYPKHLGFEAGEAGVQSQFGLDSKFKASLSYIWRSCLRKPKTKSK